MSLAWTVMQKYSVKLFEMIYFISYRRKEQSYDQTTLKCRKNDAFQNIYIRIFCAFLSKREFFTAMRVLNPRIKVASNWKSSKHEIFSLIFLTGTDPPTAPPCLNVPSFIWHKEPAAIATEKKSCQNLPSTI